MNKQLIQLSNNNNKNNSKECADGLNRNFSKEDTDCQQAHEKMFITANYQRNANQNCNEGHFTAVRMTIIEKSTNKCWKRCREKRTLLHCCWKCKFVHPLWKTVWRLLKKLKPELPYNPAIPLLSIQPHKSLIQKDTCTPMSQQHYLQ